MDLPCIHMALRWHWTASKMVCLFHFRWTKPQPCCWISWFRLWIQPSRASHLDRVSSLHTAHIYHIAVSVMQIDRRDELSKLVRSPNKINRLLFAFMFVYILGMIRIERSKRWVCIQYNHQVVERLWSAMSFKHRLSLHWICLYIPRD